MRPAARLAAVGGLAAALAACGSAPPLDPDVVTIAVPSSPNNFDPRIGTDETSQRVHQLIYRSLFALDGELQVVPELASHLERPDSRTYVVRLRQGVRFHDGRPLTAADVAYTFASFLDVDFISPRKGAYRLVDSVRALDPSAVEFRLKEPFGSFPINLVMGIVPSGSPPGLGDVPIGAGPYRFVSYAPDDRLVLRAHTNGVLEPPRNAGLVLKIVPDDTMRGLELRKGTVDLVVNDLAPDIVHQLRGDSRLQVVEAPGIDYAYIGFNLRDPVLGDVRVRQAIGHAVDRDAIVHYLRRGLGRPAVGILPPSSWAFEPGVFDFPHDPSQARRLLDEAGLPDPDGDGPRPRLRLSLKTSTADFVRLQAAVIQEDLRRVGIEVDVRSHEFETLYADVLKGNFQMFTLQWVGVTDPDMLRRVFHSRQVPPSGFNRGFFANPRVDELIDAATVSTDEAARRRLFGEVQRIVALEVPYISLWYKTNVVVAQRSLAGITLRPTADFSFLRHVRRLRGGSEGPTASASNPQP